MIKSVRNQLGWACGTYERQVRCLQSFGGGVIPEGKRPLGRPRLRWVGNITVGPEETGQLEL